MKYGECDCMLYMGVCVHARVPVYVGKGIACSWPSYC